MKPEFLTAIEAKTALETPQISMAWTYDSALLSPIEDEIWLWDNAVIRSSAVRYPEDVSEGNAVLSEAYSSSPTVAMADTSVVGQLHYYYSMFMQYTEHTSNPISIDQDIDRLGTFVTGVTEDIRAYVVTGIDGVTNITDVFTSAGSTFWTNGVQPGYWLHLHEGTADDGYYEIESVDSEVQVTLTVALTLNDVNVDFEVYSDHQEFWVSGRNYHNKQTLWRYDSKTQLVNAEVDLSGILGLAEDVVDVAYAGLVGGTEHIAFVTANRYLRITAGVSIPELLDIIEEWTFASLTPGYEVRGAVLDSTSVYVLDGINMEILELAEATGALLTTFDLSGLVDVVDSTLYGVAYDAVNNELLVGNKNYVISFDDAAIAPDTSDISSITHTRELITGGFCIYTDQLADTVYVASTNKHTEELRSYDIEVGTYPHYWQQQELPDENSIGYWRLNDIAGAPQDLTSYANHGVNAGFLYGSTGKYDAGMEADGVADNIDLIAITAEFDGAEGSLFLWFASDDYTSLDVGTHILAHFDGAVAGNDIIIQYTGANIEIIYSAGGVAELVQVAIPITDNLFHQYGITWSAADDEVKGYLDGVQIGTTQIALGVWGGALATALIGHGASAALGVYDTVHVSDVPRTIAVPVQSYTEANKMYAYSGRDYTVSFATTDPLGFFYRDELFTDTFFGGDFQLRNDYLSTKLHPPNKVTDETKELVFRGPDPLPKLGHTGRLARLVGLLIDRIADTREELVSNFHNPDTMDVETMEVFADNHGLLGLDIDNWNVDKQRRFIRVMPSILKRGGLTQSYLSYARLLGFYCVLDTLHARRRLDSVHYNANFDPRVQAIYLDTMGSLDTSDQYFPLALLRFRFYKLSVKSIIGATQAFATRLLQDAGGAFGADINNGDLLVINDPTTTDDNGEYLVEEIHSDIELKVDQDWPVGGQVALTYSVYNEVPMPDPYIDFLLSQFKNIVPDSMRSMHRNETV